MDALIQDLRYGIRQLLQQRGSSIVALLTLSLGIGVSTALFSVVDATMLRPLPYPDPEQLVTVDVDEVQPDGSTSRPAVSMADMRATQTAGEVFSAVAGWGSAFRGRIADGPEVERLEVAHFTEDYLAMHGVTPIIGRGFTRADTEPGAPLVVLLGYGHWQSRYGGRSDVIGETLRLDADTATIVGVLPASFNRTTPLATPLQIPPDWFSRRGSGRVSIDARLRPGVTIEQARDRLSPLLAALPRADARAGEVRAVVRSRLDALHTRYRTTVNVLAASVGLLLLIAALNVAGLLLARGATRQSELAVRASLGAGRARLIRQLLTESVVLALPAAALGVGLAWLTLDLVVANLPLSQPDNSPIALNGTVMALTAALLLPTTLVFGLAPAIRLSRVRIGPALARGQHQVGSPLSRRGGQLLIAAEVALAVVLVSGAGLMIRTFMNLSAVKLGFRPDGLITMEVLPLERDPAAHQAYYRALLERLRTVPGVASAGLVDNFPLGSGTSYTTVFAAGTRAAATVFHVSPGYFETIGASLSEGQWPTDAADAPGVRGVVINESAARALFPGVSAIGREVTRGRSLEDVARGRPAPAWMVLGVIADLRHGGPLRRRGIGEPQVFFPLAAHPADLSTATIAVVRRSGPVRDLGDRLREAAHAIGPRVLVERIRSADDLFGDAVMTPRRRLVLLAILGGFGLVLALVGVFAMTAYAVTRRTAEIGVRLAFGARPAQVVRTILRDSAAPIVVGTGLGVAGASAATRLIESFLFETAPRDPVTLTVVAMTLALAGCLAALGPALRAANVDPAISLRAE